MTRRLLLTALTALVMPLAAGASHPEPGEMARVQVLAHQLENAARRVHLRAEDTRHHGDYWEEKALRRLHDLEAKARHFHRQVERYRPNPYHTAEDFRALERAFYRAEEAMHWLHAYDAVERDFRRLERVMDELQYLYGHDEHVRYRRHDPRHRPYRPWPWFELRWQRWR